MKICKTKKCKGIGGKNSFWFEYHLKGDKVITYKCVKSESRSWNVSDPELPKWLPVKIAEACAKKCKS